MTINSWMIYAITRLDPINTAVGITLVMLAIAILIFTVILMINEDVSCGRKPDTKTRVLFTKLLKRCIVAMIMSFILFIAIPNQKNMIAIIFLPKIVNNDQVQKLPANMLNLVNGKLEQWINENMELETVAGDSTKGE